MPLLKWFLAYVTPWIAAGAFVFALAWLAATLVCATSFCGYGLPNG